MSLNCDKNIHNTNGSSINYTDVTLKPTTQHFYICRPLFLPLLVNKTSTYVKLRTTHYYNNLYVKTNNNVHNKNLIMREYLAKIYLLIVHTNKRNVKLQSVTSGTDVALIKCFSQT